MAVCRCGRKSTSVAQSHCTTCHRQFSGITAFDRHRVRITGGEDWERQCADPSELRTKSQALVFEPSYEKNGTVWRFAQSRPDNSFGGDAA